MDESFKYGELENLNMKQLIPSLFVLMIVGCSDSIPIEASDTPSPDDLVAHSEEFEEVTKLLAYTLRLVMPLQMLFLLKEFKHYY